MYPNEYEAITLLDKNKIKWSFLDNYFIVNGKDFQKAYKLIKDLVSCREDQHGNLTFKTIIEDVGVNE